MSTIDKEAKVAKARELYLSGYNCAQSVFAAYAPEVGMDEAAALRLSSGFGGGIGGMRGICGALSGMFMIYGMLRGYDEAADLVGKRQLYATEQAIAAKFTEAFEVTHCRALMAKNNIFVTNIPSERTPEYYKKRPCVRYIEWCAGTLADEL